ncbi:MAG: glycosyltransferase family 2 protein [bacterium]
MYKNQKIVVVMPAYNAEKTLRQTFDEVCEQGIVDTVIIVDDCSRDNTVALARSLTPPSSLLPPPCLVVHTHDKNMGYGGNQKSCYRLALEHGADMVIMVHPDCQYTPKLIPAMASMIANGLHSCVLGSRILGGYALKGGMPFWKYISNRCLTLAMNILFGAKLSEYHTGYRAFSRELIERLPLEENMDDFAFDAQMLAEILWTGATIGEVSCPTVYFKDASSISFARSCTYGIGCLKIALLYRLCKLGVMRSKKLGEMRG